MALLYHCTTCDAYFDIRCVGPAETVGSPGYCPRCGNRWGSIWDGDEHLIPQMMADKYGVPLDLFYKIWILWDVNTHPTFAAHFKALQEEED